jgi:hypothetical protein
VEVQIRDGMINRRKGNAKVSLSASEDAEGEVLSRGEVAPDKEWHGVKLATTYSGLHTIEVQDRGSGYQIQWPKGVPTVVEASTKAGVGFSGGRWSMYFYVPKGTKVIGGYRSAGAGSVKSPDGKTAFTFTGDNNPGYWSVPVPPGQDGKLWQLYNIRGIVKLMTVPPYLARSAEELLLPAEVVKADER